MRDDQDRSEPSLTLAHGHHIAHREHFHQQQQPQQQQQQQQHHHHHLHERVLHLRQPAEVTEIAAASVVTEVIQTISLVQQIDVDGNGNTFSLLTLLADATGGTSPLVLTDSDSSSTTTTDPAAAATSANSASQALSTALDTPSETSYTLSSATAASTSTPSQSQLSFASFPISANSTTIISGSSSLSHTFRATNSSSSSTSRSSLTYLKSSSRSSRSSKSSTSSGLSSSTTFTSSSSFASTSFQPTSTDSAGLVAGGTGVTPGTASSSAASSGTGTNSDSGSPVSTSAVVGGVVGSIAGVAVIALLLLFIVKWRKNRTGALLSLGSGRDGAGDGGDTGTGGAPPQPSGGMAERRSFVNAVPAALASLTGYKRSSQATHSTANSERGFVRVSGRKLPSVLQNGGDGYGGGLPDNTLSASSFYSDSHGFYGGPGTPTFPTSDMQRESGQVGTPVMRPSPARTPVTEQGPFSAISPQIDAMPPLRPDGLGRSHPSQDGSHTSRFTEEV